MSDLATTPTTTPKHVISIDYMQNLLVDGVVTGRRVTRSEEAILRAILGHSHVATKEFILTYAYGGRDEPELKIIDVFVCKVRGKLGAHKGAIVTVWGRGFRRHPHYTVAPKDEPTIAVGVDAKLVEDVAFASGEQPDAIIARLLQAERDRLWNAEAA